MLKELESYDWEQAFLNAKLPEIVDGQTPAPFGREDVAVIIASAEGENDGANWIMVGRLTDGRYFWVSAWCDYTGWD